LLTVEGHRTSWEQRCLTRLLAADPEIAATYELVQTYESVQTFGQIVRERRGDDLDAWIHGVQASGPQELHAFVQSLMKDEAAVRAGLTLSWSQGQTEGQVNRLKLLKRSSYGRASFALLRQQVLYRQAG